MYALLFGCTGKKAAARIKLSPSPLKAEYDLSFDRYHTVELAYCIPSWLVS